MSTYEKEPIELKEPIASDERQQASPTIGELYLAGPVLPIASPTFYHHAVRRSVFAALVFFVLFGTVVAILQTVRATAEFGEARAAIREAFARGDIPEVIIEDGRATVLAPQPFVAVDDGRSLVVLDTTGEYTGRELYAGGYVSGMILTRDTIYGFDDLGRPSQLSLRELDQFFPFRLHFNAALLQGFIDLAQVSVLAGLFVWRAILGPIYLVLLALGVWAVASLFKRSIGFSPVLITGFFAAIPALYGEYLMRRIDADFFLLYTLLLLMVWTVGLVSAVGTRRPGDILRGERTLRAWRAVIGFPMLIIFALDVVYNWNNGPVIVWMTAVVTVVALVVVGYLTGMRLEPREEVGKLAGQS